MNSVILFVILSCLVAVSLSYPLNDKREYVRVRRLQPRGGYAGADSYAGTRGGVTGEERGAVRSVGFKVLSDVYERTGGIYGSSDYVFRNSRVGSRVSGAW